MNARWTAAFWVVLLVVSLLLLDALSGILLPFVAGMAVAYFLDPLCDRLERLGLSRTLSTWVVTIVFGLTFLLVLALILPAAVSQVADLAQRLPSLVEQARGAAEQLLQRLDSRIAGDLVAQAQDAMSGSVGNVASLMAETATRLLSGGAAVINMLGLIFLTPVVSYFLLRDWDRMVAKVDSWLPRPQAPTIRRLAREVDEILSGYVRGVLTVCLALSVFYSVGLTLVGLPSGLIIGLTAGMLSFVPFLGAVVGFLLSVGLALLQFDDWLRIGAVMLIFFAGQALEGNVLTPKLVGDRIGLHPVIVIFVVLAGGVLFGFLGVLLALPIAAVLGVGARFALQRYLASRLYRGDRTGTPPP
ncbi:AI-2E family transporter [Aquibaculum arenosum]|uniref:AI-2E family transporter n=1 Tax=Aquibaculum arenosum TaxID=3032591 RepID=A0ABT5YQL7_9PROT|nr:AI-2E family transporter [Fodinicurvata sp. CAU 1616]MDF2097177.1 AI-2E family transporter [Fodinicurvata sp. CAU 1616]